MNKENKKIKNTNPKEFDGIKFKSTFECNCYKHLKESNLEFSYESEKITLWEGIKLDKVIFMAPKKLSLGKYGKVLEYNNKKLINITYTPDFILTKGKYKIYMDIKGKENDVYPIKRKMFLKYLEEKDDFIYYFFEPHSIKQLKEAIELIKNL